MIIAELSIFPTSEGASVSSFVKQAVQIIEGSGLKSKTGGMSTVIESPDLKTLFALIEKTHQAMVERDVKRIHIDLRIDHRLDKEATVDSKLESIGKVKA